MSDQAVLITGGAKRVGAALSLHFAQKDYDIALHYNASATEAKQVQHQVRELGVECELFPQDLTEIAALPLLMAKVQKTFPHCRTLINNASVFERAGFLQTDEILFDRQFNTNLKAPFFLTQAFAKTFGEGSVINVLDTDITKMGGSHFAYLMSKKSLADFTLMAARQLGPKVRVNGVAPGHMLPSHQLDMGYEEKLKSLLPLQTHPTLESLCEAAEWVAVQPHITGQIIHVDGGKYLI